MRAGYPLSERQQVALLMQMTAEESANSPGNAHHGEGLFWIIPANNHVSGGSYRIMKADPCPVIT